MKKNFLLESGVRLVKNLDKKNIVNPAVAKREAVDFLERYFFEKTGRRPMILPVVVEE